MANTSQSTIEVQYLVDFARTYPWTTETIGLAGYSASPAVEIANDIAQEIMSETVPWKWNSYNAPPFLTQPYQQDYPTSLSFNNVGWLESAIIIDINNNSLPTPQAPLKVVKNLQPSSVCDIPSALCFILNRNALTGVRQASTLYTNPLVSAGGGPNSNPPCAITDPNGNILVITGYGTSGSTTPTWPAANAAAGTNVTDGGVTWAVVDPNGVCFRVNAKSTNGSTVYQINPTYQLKMPLITGVTSLFNPIPDELGWLLRKGFLAYLSKHAGQKDYMAQILEFRAAVKIASGASDKEEQEFGFAPSEPIQGGPGMGPATGLWWYGGNN